MNGNGEFVAEGYEAIFDTNPIGDLLNATNRYSYNFGTGDQYENISSYSFEYNTNRTLDKSVQTHGSNNPITFDYDTDILGRITAVDATIPHQIMDPSQSTNSNYRNEYKYNQDGRLIHVQQTGLAGSSVQSKSVSVGHSIVNQEFDKLTNTMTFADNGMKRFVRTSTGYGNGQVLSVEHTFDDVLVDQITVSQHFGPRGLVSGKFRTHL